MCLREGPPPVFIDIGGARTPFLDDLFGETIADTIRSLGGYPPLHADADSAFGFSCPSIDHGYLINSFSSVWAFCVFLLAFVAGILFPFRRRVALILLGSGVILSLLDIGTRLVGYRAGSKRDLMIDGLPGQLAANALFQLVLPCVVAFALMRLALFVRRLLCGRSEAQT